MQITSMYLLELFLALSVFAVGQDPNRRLVPEKDYIVEPIDTYGELSWEDETARLDNFAIRLLNDPRLIGCVTVYAGKYSCVGAAQARGMRAKRYLVEHRGVEWNRVIWKDAGYLEQPYVMLWGQVRGQDPYPFYQPKPLPLSNVRLKDCTKVRRRKNPKNVGRAEQALGADSP